MPNIAAFNNNQTVTLILNKIIKTKAVFITEIVHMCDYITKTLALEWFSSIHYIQMTVMLNKCFIIHWLYQKNPSVKVAKVL